MYLTPSINLSPAPSYNRLALAVVGGGVAIALLGALIAANSTFGSVTFWTASAASAAATATTILGLALNFYRKKDDIGSTGALDKDDMGLILTVALDFESYKAMLFESYKAMLAAENGCTFTVSLPNFIKDHLASHNPLNPNADLNKSTAKDSTRGQFGTKDGKFIEDYNEFGEFYQFANQAASSDVFKVLQEKYRNDQLVIYPQQRAVDPRTKEVNTHFNLVTKDGKECFEITQLYQLSRVSGNIECLGYIKAKVTIDLRNNETTLTWNSPQKDEIFLRLE